MPLYEYQIGTTMGGLVNIESLPTPLPNMKSYYKQFSELVTLANGASFGRGFASAEWRWNLLTRPQRDQLRTFCPGTSAAVYIRTRSNDNEDEYKYFQAIMHFPIEEEKDTTVRMDVTIVFTHLIEQIPLEE